MWDLERGARFDAVVCLFVSRPATRASPFLFFFYSPSIFFLFFSPGHQGALEEPRHCQILVTQRKTIAPLERKERIGRLRRHEAGPAEGEFPGGELSFF
jgi:hypothetical protein